MRLFGAVGEHPGLSLPRREIERGLPPHRGTRITPSWITVTANCPSCV